MLNRAKGALGGEALRRVMERYFAEAQAAFERHGVTVEKFIGDAVVAKAAAVAAAAATSEAESAGPPEPEPAPG